MKGPLEKVEVYHVNIPSLRARNWDLVYYTEKVLHALYTVL